MPRQAVITIGFTQTTGSPIVPDHVRAALFVMLVVIINEVVFQAFWSSV